MAKFVLAYRGGSVPQSEADQQAAMQAWMGWFGSLGDSVVDGGNPFGASKTRTADGSADGAPSRSVCSSSRSARRSARSPPRSAG